MVDSLLFIGAGAGEKKTEAVKKQTGSATLYHRVGLMCAVYICL